MEAPTFSASIRRFQQENTDAYAAIALVFYTSLVYAWALTIHPLGPDYAVMAEPAHGMAPITAWLFGAEMAVFGAWAPPYHLVNAALLYLCALLVYRIGRETITGPAWLSLLAAVFYMANPVHRDAVFLLSGLDAAVPAVMGLLVVYAGVRTCRNPTLRAQAIAGIAICAAFVLFDECRAAVIPVILGLWLLPSSRAVTENEEPDAHTRPRALMATCGVVTAILVSTWIRHFNPSDWTPATMWGPLYFALYPLGFLPETIRQFHALPWLAWLSVALGVLLLVVITRKSKSRVLVWAIASALAVRMGQGDTPFNFVHLLGGRHLLLGNAFVLLGLCELFLCMIRHPKWHRAVVTGTTIGCLVLFGMQIHSAFVWKSVGHEVRAFQESFNDTESAPIGLLPDVGFYRGAPAYFGEALRHATPFSSARDIASLVILNVRDADTFRATLAAYAPDEAVVDIECDDFGYALGRPFSVGARETATTTVGVSDAVKTGGRLRIRPKDGTLPPNHRAPVE